MVLTQMDSMDCMDCMHSMKVSANGQISMERWIEWAWVIWTWTSMEPRTQMESIKWTQMSMDEWSQNMSADGLKQRSGRKGAY